MHCNEVALIRAIWSEFVSCTGGLVFTSSTDTKQLFFGWYKRCFCSNKVAFRSFAGCADFKSSGSMLGLMSQVQWCSNDDFSGQSVISRVYTSRLVTVRIAWNPGRGGTKKVPGTKYSTVENPPKVNRTEPYHAVPCSGKAPQLSWGRSQHLVPLLIFLLYGGLQTYKCITATYLSNGLWTLLIEIVDSVNGPFER